MARRQNLQWLELGDEGLQWCLNELKALARRELVLIDGSERRVSTWRIHLADALGDHVSSLGGHVYTIVTSPPDGMSIRDMLTAGYRERVQEKSVLASSFLHLKSSDSYRPRIVMGCDELTRAADVTLPRFDQLPDEIHYATDGEAAFGLLKIVAEAPDASLSNFLTTYLGSLADIPLSSSAATRSSKRSAFVHGTLQPCQRLIKPG